MTVFSDISPIFIIPAEMPPETRYRQSQGSDYGAFPTSGIMPGPLLGRLGSEVRLFAFGIVAAPVFLASAILPLPIRRAARDAVVCLDGPYGTAIFAVKTTYNGPRYCLFGTNAWAEL